MSVLHLISGRGPTGAAAAAINDIVALRAAGIRACAGCRKDAPHIADALRNASVPDADIFARFKFARGALGMLTALRDAAVLARIVRDEAVETVHVHRAGEQWLAYVASQGTVSMPLIRTWHRDPRGESYPVLHTLARHTAGCVCVSRDHERALLGAGAPRARFIQGAVDTDFFRPRANRCEGGAPVIGQAARWKRDKGRDRGQRFTLEIFSKLSPVYNWRGQLVGRGELENELTRRAFDELRLPRERVSLLSTQGKSPADFAALLNAFDIGLVFAIGSDGTSRPALELLASGVPLLVADVAGLRELADDPACALIGPGNDAAAWARTLEELLADPPRLNAMQQAARARAESVHALKIRGEALAAFYRDCAQ
ncbi:MAG TPA: glycosyltransferase family 4 protein [Planctomycetota bacterium]|nr:glycosyltransferase family 4 protein [Planctomycetota bacterium]